jgi:hypothetical protein
MQTAPRSQADRTQIAPQFGTGAHWFAFRSNWFDPWCAPGTMQEFPDRTWIELNIVLDRTWIAVYSSLRRFTRLDRTRFDALGRVAFLLAGAGASLSSSSWSFSSSSSWHLFFSASANTGTACDTARQARQRWQVSNGERCSGNDL